MSTEPLYSFQLPRGLLKAMTLFQSSDETRFALVATSFEIVKAAGGHHQITLVSTDGRRLATYNAEILADTLWGELPDAAHIVVDLSGCKKLPKVTPVDMVTCEVFEKRVEFVANSLRYTAERRDAMDGGSYFPEWRTIIPAGEPEKTNQIMVNHGLLFDFGKAAKLVLGDKGTALNLRTYGEDAAISVQFPDHREFYGLIMPLKSKNPEAVPDWMKHEKKRASKITKADIAVMTDETKE